MGKSICREVGARESMAPHPEFLELCAAAFAGELSDDEQRNLAPTLPNAQTAESPEQNTILLLERRSRRWLQTMTGERNKRMPPGRSKRRSAGS